MLIFFDTEFTDLADDAKLISIGLIDETGERTFYAELSDTWSEDDLSEFAVEEVLPHLGEAATRISLRELRRRLADWLASFTDEVQLATDSVSWDWMWIVEIFGPPGNAKSRASNWPQNLAPHPHSLDVTDEWGEVVEESFATTGLRRHHALDDARVNRLVWLAG